MIKLTKMFSTKYNKDEKLWYGPETLPLFNPQISLAQALLNSMSVFGNKIAQISDDSEICMTFDEMRIKTIRAAQNLQALGYKPKEVFTFITGNSHFLAPAVFASIAIGCPINFLDPSFGQVELHHMLKITKPTLVFCDKTRYDLVRECLAELGNSAKVFTFGGKLGQSEPIESLFEKTHREEQFIPVKVDAVNEAALIVCSSGTTGLSKGVCLSHATLLDMPKINSSSDVMLCFSSLYWVSGITTLMKGALWGSTRIITTEIFSPELELCLIEKYKVTYTMNAPHQIILMMKSNQFSKTDLSSIKYLTVSGSKVPFHIKAEMSRCFPSGNVVVLYGMGETAGSNVADFPMTIEKDSVGRLAGGTWFKVIDDNGNRCGVNEDGELCIKRTYRFLGYYGDQKATEEIFDADCFIKTGDIGHFDEDGDLFFVDRKKDIIKYYNFPISPSEIDAFLTTSSDIKSACVVGIPDSLANDLPAAAIVRAEESTISKDDVFNMVSDHFADHYKLRGGVFFVASLPTTPSGKILRRKVRESIISLLSAQNL